MKTRLLSTLVAVLAFTVCGALLCSRSDDGDPANTPQVRFEGPDWYKHVVFYEIWVRSFYDSDGDGIGDLKGITQKMDYIASLGIGGIWLTPFYPTPFFDSGYDVADYRSINPEYGTMDDFDALLAAAHAHGIRVFSDLVMNHTSIEHPWFIASKDPNSDKRDWYMWADEPNIPCTPADPQFGDTGWVWDEEGQGWYFHQFYPQQPDLNYRNPEVVAEMLDTARFWLDKGVDGFRVDAILTLFEDEPSVPEDDFICINHPQPHEFLKQFRSVLDEYPNTSMVAEAWANPEETAKYCGDGSNEFHMTFSLNLSVGTQMALLFGSSSSLAEQIALSFEPMPQGGQFGLWLSNHDQPRVMGSVEDDARRAAVAAVMLMTLPGTPFLYYGDEIGMTNGSDIVVDKRDESRTPMAWAADAGVGFTTGDPWLDPSPGAETANVAVQDNDPASLLNLHRNLIALRNEMDVFGTGDFTILSGDSPGNEVITFIRRNDEHTMLVILSFSDTASDVRLNLSSLVTRPATSRLSSMEAPILDSSTASGYTVNVPAYGYAIWEL